MSIRAHRAGEQVSLEVRDNGPGMSPEVLEHVREPFFTTKGSEGSGLELAVCDQIMGELGGTMELESALGQRTTIRLWLPAETVLVLSKQGEGVSDSRNQDQSQSTRRILIVDDEEALARMLSKLLRPHETVLAHSGDEAIARIGDSGPFDVVLLDVMLVGERGLDVYAKLPEALQSRVAFMTGGIFDPEMQAELESLENPMLTKPFSRASVHAVVEAMGA